MSGKKCIICCVFCALIFLFMAAAAAVSAVDSTTAAAQESHDAATLPLPDPTPEDMASSGWPAGRPLSNLVRAWHYNPGLVRPLLDIGRAVEESALSFTVRRMLAAVVASRNNCFY